MGTVNIFAARGQARSRTRAGIPARNLNTKNNVTEHVSKTSTNKIVIEMSRERVRDIN